MSQPDFLPLVPGLHLEYALSRAQGRETLVVEHSAGPDGSVNVRRTWRTTEGKEESETSRAERRADGVYFDGELVLPLPPRAGVSWARPPREYRVEETSASAETPAGRFTGCLHVVYLIAAGDGGSGERFYAPGLGLVRETCADESDPFELVLTSSSRPGGL
ncbi:MAG: hypothetical protein A2506_04025 [Elusimicrobia bacterium RIFOXYD12_FULL_66_9]|nr:MAG: hypothetical protein A2506_04025 [Elusimicrobia bacterium RIFOXYD12_FULL_66_9]